MQKIITILCVLFIFISCSTTKQSGPDNNVIKHNEEIIAATTRVDCSIERLDLYQERLGTCEGTVEELIKLFDDYIRGVEQLKSDYYKLRDILESQEQRFDLPDLGDYY